MYTTRVKRTALYYGSSSCIAVALVVVVVILVVVERAVSFWVGRAQPDLSHTVMYTHTALDGPIFEPKPCIHPW